MESEAKDCAYLMGRMTASLLIFLLAIAAGTVVSAALVLTLKSTKKAETQLVQAEAAAGIPTTV